MQYAIHHSGSSLFPSRRSEAERLQIGEKNALCLSEAQILRPNVLTVAALRRRTAGTVLARPTNRAVDAKLPWGSR